MEVMNPFLAGQAPPVPVLNIGHRGCAHEPENTLPAFARALELGAHMVEFDVREGLAVCHDPPGRRSVPRLADVLKFLAATPLYVNVELKVEGLAKEAVRLLERFGLVERTIVSSFLHDQVARVKRLNPAIAGGVLSQDRLADPARYVREIVGADVYSPGRAVFARAPGVGVHVWTVNDPGEMRRLIAAGATGLFTDFPERLRKVLAPSPRLPDPADRRTRGRSR